MANWRRGRENNTVHVVPEHAPALCELDRDKLGATVWDAGIAAPDLCPRCSRRLLALTDEAVRLTEKITDARDLELAKAAARSLQRVVPDGVTRDLVVYARACIVRGDRKGAHESIERWRQEMRVIGMLPQR